MKKILLTGATDGIGLETAKLLAAQGHHLLIHGRSEKKLANTEEKLQAQYPNAKIESYRADLSNLNDIKSMLQSLVKTHHSIDVIINNAGVFKTPANNILNTGTADGLDIRFVVNTFAPFIITQTLLPLLADDGRIINLSSAAQAPINLAAMLGEMKGNMLGDKQGERPINDDFQAYAQSKLAITIWSQELAPTLKPNQVVMAVNPGSLLASKMVKEGFGIAGNDLSIGAEILVKTALSEEFKNASGKYFDNDTKAIALPHGDAQNQQTCNQVIEAIKNVTAKYYGDLRI